MTVILFCFLLENQIFWPLVFSALENLKDLKDFPLRPQKKDKRPRRLSTKAPKKDEKIGLGLGLEKLKIKNLKICVGSCENFCDV